MVTKQRSPRQHQGQKKHDKQDYGNYPAWYQCLLFLTILCPAVATNTLAPFLLDDTFIYVWLVGLDLLLVTSYIFTTLTLFRDAGFVHNPIWAKAAGLPHRIPISENSCENCGIVKRLGTKHCSICNKCVDMFDHHSRVLNICIGKRNHRTYIFLLCFTFMYFTSTCDFCLTVILKTYYRGDLGPADNLCLGLFMCIAIEVLYPVGLLLCRAKVQWQSCRHGMTQHQWLEHQKRKKANEEDEDEMYFSDNNSDELLQASMQPNSLTNQQQSSDERLAEYVASIEKQCWMDQLDKPWLDGNYEHYEIADKDAKVYNYK